MTDCRFSVKVGEHFPTLAELGCGTHFRGGFPPIPREIKKQVPFGFAQDGRMGHGVLWLTDAWGVFGGRWADGLLNRWCESPFECWWHLSTPFSNGETCQSSYWSESIVCAPSAEFCAVLSTGKFVVAEWVNASIGPIESVMLNLSYMGRYYRPIAASRHLLA